MRVLQINCTYADGSTGKIVRDINLYLKKKDIESYVLYPFSENVFISENAYMFSNRILCKINAIYTRLLGLKYDGAYVQNARLKKRIRKIKPDIVHLHCINGYDINVFKLLNSLSNYNIPTIFTLHAEFPYTGNCGHAYDCEKWKCGCGNCPNLKEATSSVIFDTTRKTWLKFQRAYNGFDTNRLAFTAVSPWLLSRARMSPLINRFKIQTVLNGIDINIFKYNNNNTTLRESLGIKEDERIIFHATANFDPYSDNLKGAKYVLKVAKALLKKGVRVVVAANYANLDKTDNCIIFVGKIASQEEMAHYYSMADITLVTSKRETFSMVTAESLCCGTPVVGFLAGGPESIAIREFTEFVEYGNEEKLVKVCEDNLFGKKRNKNEIAKISQQKYSSDVIYGQYLDLYKKMMQQ